MCLKAQRNHSLGEDAFVFRGCSINLWYFHNEGVLRYEMESIVLFSLVAFLHPFTGPAITSGASSAGGS